MAWWQWIVLAAIIGLVGFLVWFRKKQAGAGPGGNRPPQRGIIK